MGENFQHEMYLCFGEFLRQWFTTYNKLQHNVLLQWLTLRKFLYVEECAVEVQFSGGVESTFLAIPLEL